MSSSGVTSVRVRSPAVNRYQTSQLLRNHKFKMQIEIAIFQANTPKTSQVFDVEKGLEIRTQGPRSSVTFIAPVGLGDRPWAPARIECSSAFARKSSRRPANRRAASLNRRDLNGAKLFITAAVKGDFTVVVCRSIATVGESDAICSPL